MQSFIRYTRFFGKVSAMETRIITSQYVQIDQTPAGIGERIFARMLDYLLMVLYAYGLNFLVKKTGFSIFSNNQHGAFYTFLVASPVIFYSLLWELMNNGRSPGKMAFGIRVVMRDGTTPTFGAHLMRWMLMLIDMWFSWIGIIFMLLNKNNQRLGDLAAGTIVIKERDYHRIHVSLDEFDYLRGGYRPFYPQAENLSLDQANIIHEALHRFDAQRPRRIAELSGKVRDFLKINPSGDDETFLHTLTRDYQYYVLEEV